MAKKKNGIYCVQLQTVMQERTVPLHKSCIFCNNCQSATISCILI